MKVIAKKRYRVMVEPPEKDAASWSSKYGRPIEQATFSVLNGTGNFGYPEYRVEIPLPLNSSSVWIR
jgi:hypothetical protein